MGIYEFTCQACHNKVRLRKAQGEELAETLCEACALDEALSPAADEADWGKGVPSVEARRQAFKEGKR